MWKRGMDMIISMAALLLFSPVIAVVAVLVRLKLGSPVVFRQQRPGLHGKPFYLYKFRTMNEARDSQGELFPDDVRLTPFGRLLRKYSLDELLQFVNVMKGELSIVGPRPLLMHYLPLYTEEQSRRHLVKPGITGWAQVNGRNDIEWDDRLKLDVWYVEHRSLRLDLRIMWLTFRQVIKSEGISHEHHATMPFFEGSASRYEA
ncbi:sugar transferase [Paenibacillus gansuensis]|uniref:Sugar transferase n=1 Tax=Paenibacillus gansuensis TaxID=306542 RepID=A0ABW5PEZ4_9BACL